MSPWVGLSPPFKSKRCNTIEGGIVREIMVREGSEVKANQPLIVLELTVSSADVAELRVRLTSLETDIAQFEALSEGKDTATFSDQIHLQNHCFVSSLHRKLDHPLLVNSSKIQIVRGQLATDGLVR